MFIHLILQGLEALQLKQFDIALVDLSLPDSNIEDTISTLSSIQTSVPIIILSSLQDIELGQPLIAEGAQDFLPKDSLHKTLLHRMAHYTIERKRNQVELEEQATNQETFCRSLSHDFKAPTRNIGQLTSMLKSQMHERNVLNEQDNEVFELIDSRLTIVRALVDGLHDYLQSGQMPILQKPIDLNILVTEIHELLGANEDKKITLNCAALPTIKGEKAQLFMMLQNLIGNAIKYCKSEPEIHITASPINKKTASGEHLRHEIQIIDNGIGIDERFLDQVFAPFKRLHSKTEYDGSGLGLSIVRQVMKNHKGHIDISSEIGKGTCVTLQFP
ncbi:MAG: ATP-binding protein [Glaciecola sp.]